MSAVCILTPLVITSWPTLTAAITAAAAAMGFAVTNTTAESEAEAKSRSKQRTVETEVENSEVIQEGTARGQKIVVQKSDVTVEFAQDQRGRCTLCVTGTGYTDAQLRKMGQEVAGRIVKTNSPHVQGSRVTLVNMNFNDMLADESLLQKLQRVESLEQAKTVLKGVKGFTFNFDREVNVEFAGR